MFGGSRLVFRNIYSSPLRQDPSEYCTQNPLWIMRFFQVVWWGQALTLVSVSYGFCNLFWWSSPSHVYFPCMHALTGLLNTRVGPSADVCSSLCLHLSTPVVCHANSGCLLLIHINLFSFLHPSPIVPNSFWVTQRHQFWEPFLQK